MGILYEKSTGLTLIGLAIIAIFIFLSINTLDMDKITRMSSVMYAITSLAILYTAYQSYVSYNLQSKINIINQNMTSYVNLLGMVDNETYKRWNPNLNGLSVEQHKLMSIVGVQIENAEKLYNFTSMSEKPKTGWYQQIKTWVLDPNFIRYWETDYKTYTLETIELVNDILNLNSIVTFL